MDSEYISNGSNAFFADLWEERPANSIRSIVGWEDPDSVPIRIGIVGAFGTDKNILARSLAQALDIPLIERIPRTVKNLGYDLNKSVTAEAICAMWFAQTTEQIEIVEFVTDNTLLTYVAYANVLLADNREVTPLVTAMTNLTMTAFNEQYSIVFYVPPGETIRNNGIRSRDKRLQAEIDAAILKYLNNFDVDYFPLTGDAVQKFDLAMMFLEDAGFVPRT